MSAGTIRKIVINSKSIKPHVQRPAILSLVTAELKRRRLLGPLQPFRFLLQRGVTSGGFSPGVAIVCELDRHRRGDGCHDGPGLGSDQHRSAHRADHTVVAQEGASLTGGDRRQQSLCGRRGTEEHDILQTGEW